MDEKKLIKDGCGRSDEEMGQAAIIFSVCVIGFIIVILTFLFIETFMK